MAMDELKSALESNPNDTRTFQGFLEPILREGTQDQFDEFLATVMDAVEADDSLANLMRATDFKAKSVGGELAPYVTFHVGKVFLDRIGNEDMAEMYFRRVPADFPQRSELNEFYVGFYVRKENWRKLEQLFTEEAQRDGTENPVVAAKKRTARLAEERGKADRALAYWQALRKEAPNDPEVQERLIELYEQTGKWHQVADVLKAKADNLPGEEVDGKIALYHRLIPLYRDKLKMEAKVSATFQAILKLQPDNEQAFEALCEHYKESNRWPDLVKILKARIEATEDDSTILGLHRQVATIMEERFNNVTEAMRSYEVMHQLAPEDLDVLRKLKSLYEARRDWAKYIDVAKRELEFMDGDEKTENLRELARLSLQNVRDFNVGIALWKEVRADSPEDQEAFDAMMHLCERGKNFEGVAELLEERIEQVALEEQQQLLERLATIYASRIQDIDQAATSWKRLLELDPESHRAKAELKKILVRAKDLESLDGFFRSHGNLRDYARTLELMAKDEEEDVLKVQVLFRVAGIYQEEGGKEDKARGALEQILAVDSLNVDAAQQLAPLYEALERWEELVGVQELLLNELPDMGTEERLELLLSKAAVHEQKLEQIEDAFFTYVSAYQLQWSRTDVHDEMERLAEASGNWETYISVLEQTLDLVDDVAYQVPYLLRIAEIWENKLDDSAAASECYNRALAVDDGNRVALTALARLYRKAGQWEPAKEIIEKQLAIETAADERKLLLQELGEVCLDLVGDAAGAIEAYNTLVTEFPDYPEAYDRLSAVLLTEQRRDELLQLLEARLSALMPEGAPLAELLVDIGMLYYAVHGDCLVAADRYIAALNVNPDNPMAVSLLEELIGAEEVQLRVARALEPVYGERGDLDRLADVLEIELAWLDDIEKVGVLSRLKDLYLEGGNLQNASIAVRRLLRLVPDDAALRLQLEDIAEKLDEWFPVVSLYGELVELISDQEYRHEVMRATASLYHLQIGDRELARQLYHAVLEETPDDAASLGALQGIAFEDEDWAALLSIYETRKEMEHDIGGKIEVMFDIANLCREHLEDPDRAAGTVEEVLELDPTNVEALRLLDGLYTAQEKWDDLMRALEQMCSLAAEDSVRVELLLRMAELFERRLNDPEGMVDKLEQVLQTEPHNQAAVEMLERNIEGDIALHALDLLDSYMRSAGNWQRLIDLLALRRSLVDDAMEQLAILKEVARIYEEELENQKAAFENYRIALALSSEDEDVLSHLLQLAEYLANFEDLFLVLDEETGQMDEIPQQVQMWRIQATIARDKLNDQTTAVEYFRRVMEREPDDLDTVEALSSLYREAESWSKLVEVLAAQAELVADLEEKKALYLEMGAIYYGYLEAAEQAIFAYEEILNLDHEDITALSNLENLYGETEKWDELEQILQRRAAGTSEPDEGRELLLRRAEVLDVHLQRLDEANQVLGELFSQDPQDMALVQKLEALHEKREDWFSLLDILRHKLTLASGYDHFPIMMKMARTHADRTGDSHEAVNTYQAVLEQFPEELEPIDDLERLVLENEDKERAFNLLKPYLQDKGEWERLLVSIGAFKDSLDDDQRKLELLLEMAGIAQTNLTDLERAFYLAAEALSLAPQRTDVLELLEGIGHRADMLSQVVEVYASAAEDAEGVDDQILLLKRKAEVLKKDIQDFERAVEEYEKLRELDPDLVVLEALDELYTVLEGWDKLAEVLREEIELSPGTEEKLAFFYRLADVAEESLDDAARATEVIKEAYMLDTSNEGTLYRLRRLYDEKVGDPEAAELLEAHYSADERWEDVAAVLERRFVLSEARDDRLEICQKLINVFLNRLENKGKGLNYCGEALVLDPEDYASLDMLRRLKDETGMVDDAVDYLQLARTNADDVEAYRNLGMEAGQLLRETDRFDEAEITFSEVIERDEEFLPAWKALESLYENLSRVQDHERVLCRLVELEEYEDDRIPLLLKLGRLRRDQLDDSAQAIEAFVKVVELDERNEEALHSLAALYEMGEEYDKLTGILTNMADLATEADDRIAVLSQLAQLYEEKLGQTAQAIASWHDVLDWSPTNPEVLANLQRLYEVDGEWQSLVEMAERESNLEGTSVERKTELWRKIARAASEHLDDAMLAQQNWDLVIEAEPEDQEAQNTLVALYRQNEDFMKLARLVERLAANDELDSSQRVAHWQELGRLKMDEVMDPEGAIAAWNQVLALDQTALEAYDSLERLYLENARFEEAVALLQDKLPLLDGNDDKVKLLDVVAGIQEESLNLWEQAAETRLVVIGLAPSGLEQYDRVASIFENHEQWTQLADLLTKRLDVEDDEIEKVAALTRLAELYEEKLNDDRAALNAVSQALEIAQGDLELLDIGQRIATRAELWEELYVLWASSVEHLEDDRRLETMFKLGELTRDRLANATEAVEWFERVFADNPDEEKALAALVDLYEQIEEWEKLANTLEQLSQVTADFQKQVEFSLQLGDTLRERLQEADKAQAAYRQVLELDPTEERAVDALQALYTESEDWENLIDILQIRATLHPEEDAQLKLISGELLENQLGDSMRAAELYEELVTYDPSTTEAFDRLERIYTEAEVWDRLVETYERVLAVTVDEEARVETLKRLALLNETVIEDMEAAADFYQQILDVRPDDRDTIAALEKLYEQQDRFDDLVLVLQRAVQLSDTVREKVAYLEKVATLYAEQLDDLHSAIMSYKEILEHDPGHVVTLERLEKLLGEEGDWMEVLNVLDLRLRIASDVDEVVTYYLRKGQIYKDELMMLDKAREQYHMALERNPDLQEAIDLLIDLYEEEENWEKIIDLLLAQARAVEGDERRGLYFAQMGFYMKERIGDVDGAIEVYEAALEKVPNLNEALSPLAEIYMEREQWEKAFPLLEMQRQLLEEEASSEQLADLYRKLGMACLSTGNRDQALEHYRAAYDREPEDLETLEGLARLNLQQGNHEVAEAYYRSLLDKGEDDFDQAKRVAIYRALGEIDMSIGKPDSAKEHLARVLELQPSDTDCLQDLANLMEQYEDWDGVIRYRRQLADLLEDPLDQWKMLISIGDVYRERLDNLEYAIKAYNEALEAQPYSKSALVKLLEIHINAKAFSEAINVLQHLVQVEDNPQRKGNYLFTIATIYRQELAEPEMAVDYYEQSLDLNADKLEAFRAIDEILTEAKDWEGLEGGYRRMINRIRGKGNNQVEFALYKGLGEIYRSRLKQPDLAASSYEMASKLKIDDVKVHEILAQLYDALGQTEKAVAEHRKMVYLEPERVESYRKMAELFRNLSLEDDAFFSMAVLAMGGKLTDDEKSFYERKQPTGLVSAQRSFDASLWSRTVFSKAESIHVGEVFQTIYQAVGAYLDGKEFKELGLKKKDEVDMQKKTIFTTVFRRVSELLGIPPPKVYLSDRSFGISIEPTVPPVLVIGKDMLHGKSEKELAFTIAKNLTYFHPMHLLAACYPAAVLKLFYQVAVKYIHPDTEVEGGDAPQFQNLFQHMQKRMSPQLANALAASINHFVKRQKKPGVSKWLTGVELTANHAGLLACLDVQVAANVLRQESIAFSKLPPREKAKELVLYAVSEEFAQARQAVGLELPR